MAYEIMFLVSSLGLALLIFAFVCYLKCCSSNAGGEGGERGYFADDPARIPARGNVANLFMQNNNKHNNNTASQDITDCSRPTTSEKEAAGRGGGDLSDAELSQMFQPPSKKATTTTITTTTLNTLLPEEMASPLVPEGVLLSVGDFAFIHQIMKLDVIIDEAIRALQEGNFANYREVCEIVHNRISSLEDEQAAAEAAKTEQADPERPAPGGDDEEVVPSAPLPLNRVYYVFTEIFREGVAQAPAEVLQTRLAVSDYILDEATGAIRAWIAENMEEDFLPPHRVTSLVKEIVDVYRHYQVTGRGGGPQADWSNRDACLAMLGLEPTEEFLALSAFTTEQDAILEKFISIGLNYREPQQQQQQQQQPPPPARMEPLIEEEEDDYDARDEVEGDDDDDDGAEVIDLFAYNQVLADIEEVEDEVEQPRYNLRGLTRRRRRNTSSSSSSSSSD